ncbi:triggering receptor expressed on myeloid cells 1-like isoform X2 [Nannospalax galili]|uniref:triggering receptor expressed on myeloid cells 1-like isoform X2 n=1 Tax=Nannospalax galili TaxID=1026970 RepID=UPI00111BFA25|nr:triggering receptor expressed on myeloid cells 1-like isoform X2 [Nannospalax galili]
MRRTRFLGLLWTFLLSEIQAAADPAEERYDRTEGQTLTVGCPFNIMKYSNSQKAWQKLPAGGEPLTLVVTKQSSGKPSQVQVGRYMLTDDPTEAMLHVQMADLRVEDSGLYRCVIYYPLKNPDILYHPVRLVVTKDSLHTPAPDVITTKNLVEVSTHTTTKDMSIYTRVPMFSIVVPVVCGLLSKTLIFLVLFAITERSFR